MDRVRIIIAFEWRAFWRRFSRAGLRAGNQGLILIFSVFIAIKYFQFLQIATANIARGNPNSLASVLAIVFLAWLFPLAGNTRETLASRKWLHLPLSLRERFVVRTMSLLMPPAAWLVVAGSVAICYPLAHAPNPGMGIVAGLFFVAFAWLTGLTISHLVNVPFWRMLFWTTGLLLAIIAAFYVSRGGAPGNLLSFPFSPIKLVERAALGSGGNSAMANGVWSGPSSSLFLIGLLAVGAGTAALWSFKKSLAAVAGISAGKVSLFSFHFLPGRLGGLIAKDFRYFRKLLDIYLGFAVALLACVYLVVATVPSAGIFWSFLPVIFLCNAAIAFNSFGLDRQPGLDRYALLPLSGAETLLSKNVAYLIVVGAQILPTLILAGWRFGIVTSTLGLLEAGTMSAAYLAWGNWMSVSHPLKMQFFRFANSGAALVDAMGGVVFGSLPGIAMIFLLHRERASAATGTALIVLLTCSVYALSVVRFGGSLPGKRERIAETLG